jgi:hypothetical protein
LSPVLIVDRHGLPFCPPQSELLSAEPAAGVEVTVTTVPTGKLAWHEPDSVWFQFSFSHGFPSELVIVQLIPAGELVTVPLPQPSIQTLNLLLDCAAAAGAAGSTKAAPRNTVTR